MVWLVSRFGKVFLGQRWDDAFRLYEIGFHFSNFLSFFFYFLFQPSFSYFTTSINPRHYPHAIELQKNESRPLILFFKIGFSPLFSLFRSFFCSICASVDFRDGFCCFDRLTVVKLSILATPVAHTRRPPTFDFRLVSGCAHRCSGSAWRSFIPKSRPATNASSCLCKEGVPTSSRSSPSTRSSSFRYRAFSFVCCFFIFLFSNHFARTFR